MTKIDGNGRLLSERLKDLVSSVNEHTVKPLKKDTPRDKPNCPSYRDVRLMEVF